jgi:hypothetical protein
VNEKHVNERNQIHNFVSSSGSDFLTSYGSGSTTLVTGADQEPPLKILPGLEKYEPPERSKVQKNQYQYLNTVSLALWAVLRIFLWFYIVF